jgi:acyl dehydratase
MSEPARLAPRRGLYFEEFVVGDEMTSVGRTVTEADIVSFAALTGDWNQIHTDAEYC